MVQAGCSFRAATLAAMALRMFLLDDRIFFGVRALPPLAPISPATKASPGSVFFVFMAAIVI
jgi:hypothetical protein